MKLAAGKKRLVVLVLAIFIIAAVAVTAASGNIGSPKLPKGDVIYVQDGGPQPGATKEDYDLQFKISAFTLGVEADDLLEDDPQWQQVHDNAVQALIQSRWLRGEAEERGITPSEREIDDELDRIKNEQFEGEKDFNEFIEESPYTDDAVREVILLGLLSQKIQEASLPDPQNPPKVSNRQIRDYYEKNEQMFEQAENRDVRIFTAETKDEAEKAKEMIEDDSSEEGWSQAISEFGLESLPTEGGGLQQGVTRGANPEDLDEQIFSAPTGELVGPFEASDSWYLIKVEAANPASKQTLAEAKDSITQQIQQSIQNAAGQKFGEEFQAKWKARTVCADGYIIALCSNYVNPSYDTCIVDDPSERKDADKETLEAGCEAWIQQRPVVQPGNTYLVPGTRASAGQNCNPPLGNGQACYVGPQAIRPAPETPEGFDPSMLEGVTPSGQ